LPVLNSNDEWDLDQLVAIHGLNEASDKQFAIDGIAIDLDISPAEALELLISKGYINEAPK
jgi:hypothetical protein